jgi:hypothetical protein
MDSLDRYWFDSPLQRYTTAVGVASALQKTARKLRREVIQLVGSVWFDGFGVGLIRSILTTQLP